MTQEALPTKIFNTEKSDYTFPEIILGQDLGLFDTINKFYPEIWKLYKTLKNQDWDENEFDYSTCNVQFKTCDRHTYDMMVKTLAWQWEADSVASRSIAAVLAPVCTSSEAWSGWVEITKNEIVHAATYSEIVRNSFDNPDDILNEILSVKEAISRLRVVSEVFNQAFEVSYDYARGQRENDQETYNAIYLFIVAVLCMERIQFLASFAVTFGICDGTGLFQPIGKAVQKIAQDEFEVHVQYGKEVLRAMFKTERGRTAFAQCRDKIVQMIDEVTASEVAWTDYAFSEGRELTGVTCQMMKDWVHFSATDVARFFNVQDQVSFPIITENPLKYMESWLNMSKVQASNQEEDTAQYKVGVMKRDDENEVFDVDF
ncbi:MULTISPECIES: ribonucleotide-diphosphate reductase subunit beta [Castellaniella]|nr:ribonucleotide-diphosphate reductase subunit beta [Castellaniella sp.]HET8703166.1 ribonucleotide-diphosphate reductase subunit beta [Castellaniella sp.]